MKKVVFEKILIKSEKYKIMMDLMELCLGEGGWVNFSQIGEFIDCTMYWEDQDA